jgi:aerobic carbon-monoxide dehydrogenase medium subunit
VLQPFRLHEPTTPEEASRTLSDLGEDAGVYAGGTELLVAMKQGLLRYPHLVNIKPIGLDRIGYDDDARSLRIGATATHRSVERSPIVRSRFPMIAEMEARVANVRVRATGTVGGNLCFAEPHSDVATALLLHDAAVEIHGAAGRRRVPLREFLVDAYTTCLRPGDIVLQIEVPALPAGTRASYQKVAFLERPSVGVGTALIPARDGESIAEARVAVGCVGPTPFRVPEAEAALRGASLAEAAFQAAAREAAQALLARCDPAGDLYGSRAYKRHLASVLARRTAAEARDRLLAGRAPRGGN